MDFKQFFKTLVELRKISNKNYFNLLIDVFYCAVKYEAGYIDYKVFEMYKYSNEVRKTFVTRGINNRIVKKYNDFNNKAVVSDKIEFNKLFSKYLNREWLDLRECSFADFVSFCQNKDYIFIKPVDEICGRGVERIEVSNANLKEVYDYIISKGIYLVEEQAIQHPLVASLNPKSINTLRLVTINNNGVVDIIFGVLRIGNGKFIDNLNQGGLAAPIDIEKGMVIFGGTSKNGEQYQFHPLTKAEIRGLVIPNYQKCCQLVKDAAMMVPELGYLGWDVYITNESCGLIEANEFPGHDLYQLPGQLVNNEGVLPYFKKYIDFI